MCSGYKPPHRKEEGVQARAPPSNAQIRTADGRRSCAAMHGVRGSHRCRAGCKQGLFHLGSDASDKRRQNTDARGRGAILVGAPWIQGSLHTTRGMTVSQLQTDDSQIQTAVAGRKLLKLLQLLEVDVGSPPPAPPPVTKDKTLRDRLQRRYRPPLRHYCEGCAAYAWSL